MSCTLFITTSIPTPRPEISVIVLAVDNPGVPNNSIVFSSEISLASCCVNIPFSTALAFTFSRSIPLPSSSILMAICSPT